MAVVRAPAIQPSVKHAVFTIEYTILRGRDQPTLVERMRFFGDSLFGAEQMAIFSFEKVKRWRRETPPDSYRILDNNDNVVLRWQEAARPAPAKRALYGKTHAPAR
jgi:hypothetical protein